MVQVGTSGATKTIMMANGEQGKCMAKAPSDGRLVSGMMESGLREKSRAWGCSHGVMALPMMVSGSLERSMASGYAAGQCVVSYTAYQLTANHCRCAAVMHVLRFLQMSGAQDSMSEVIWSRS